jgi:hypothetical protein
MRIIRGLRPLVALLALAVAAPAAASVTYVFNTNPNSGFVGSSATFTVDDFITAPSTTITSFDSCSVGFGTVGSPFIDPCTSILILISGGQSSIQLNGTTLTTEDPFGVLAFSTLGTNFGATYSNSTASTLVVSNSAGAVPEPATWAMMLLGFAGIGIAMRRRRDPTLA